jgi:hypothetical protein
MRNLHYYMQIPFGSKEHSIAELSGFTADHLNRMTDNNTGGFLTARIAATTTAFSTFAQGSLDDQTQVAIRGALVKAKENFRRDLPVDIQKVYGQCLGHYSEAGVEMKQIFPEGRSVFGKCRDTELAGKLGVMVAGVTAKQADLGAPLVTQATAILTNWNAIYAASLGSLSDQGATQEARKEARENLCLQLYLNLLAIAAQFPGQEEKLDIYMKQHLLENPEQSNDVLARNIGFCVKWRKTAVFGEIFLSALSRRFTSRCRIG